MRKIFMHISMLIAVFCAISCSDDDTPDSYLNGKLEASTTKLDFSKEGGNAVIEITINALNTYVAVWQGGEWGQVYADLKKSQVIVTVEPNEIPEKRNATIMIIAQNGGDPVNVSLTQAGSDLSFEIMQKNVSFTRLGGEAVIDIITNSSTWSVKADDDWLKIIPKVSSGEIKIVADQYSGEESRTVTLTVQSGLSSDEIVVKQTGTHAYLLPHQGIWWASIVDVDKFEAQRESKHTHVETFYEVYDMYTTTSSVVPTIIYTFDTNNGILNSAIGYIDNSLLEHEKMVQALLDDGFTKETDDGGEFFVKIDAQHMNLITYIYNYDEGLFGYYVEWIQPEMPTFDAYPYGLLDWGANWIKVEEYENSIGGIFDKDNSINYTRASYKAKQGTNYESRRYIFTDKEKTPEAAYYRQSYNLFYDMQLAWFEFQPGYIRLTKEYVALLQSEGFEYYGVVSGFPAYGRKVQGDNEKLYLLLLTRALEPYGDATYLAVNVWQEELSAFPKASPPKFSPQIKSINNGNIILNNGMKFRPVKFLEYEIAVSTRDF